MKIWIRKRLDIATKDLLFGLKYCLMPGSRISVTSQIQSIWENDDQKSLICLSVRTGFDLLFQALNLEPGSEILMSALTIPDMPKIVAHHGLVPVAIDINPESLIPSTERIEAAITSKTKVLVIAHLFGGISDLKEIGDIAKKHHLLVIEDCAQAFYSSSYTGSSNADISMFSFGTIKTATALGGGILLFRNTNLPLKKIQELHHSYPFQQRRTFLMKIFKYFLLNLLSSPKIFPILIKLLEKRGIDYDSYIHGLSRSFPHGNFFDKIQRQPGLPLLKLMLHRFKTYDFSTIEKRIERGAFLVKNLPESFFFPGIQSLIQTYWAFPVLTSEPAKLVSVLKLAGFDATHKSSLKIVEHTGENHFSSILLSKSILDQVVFLPLYPEMPFVEFERMIDCIKMIGHK
jgi:perosamine synthetase